MESHTLLRTSFRSFASQRPQFRTTKFLRLPKSRPNTAFFNRKAFTPFRLPHPERNANSKVLYALRFEGPMVGVEELSDIEDCDLVVETCITRTLPPALTLERGLESIREVVEKLKQDPPRSSSGIFRFQVAVPPSPKALNWFCCQPESSGVFPCFFLSKETENPTSKTLYLNRTRGAFGIGAAICFSHSCSGKQQLNKRYILNDSTFLTSYGLMGIDFDTELSSVKLEAGSFYFFVPQIELDEHGDVSILAATLAWNDSLFWTFGLALDSCESSLFQAISHLWPTTERCHTICLKSALSKLAVVEDKTVSMVYMNAFLLGQSNFGADLVDLVLPFS